MPFLGRDWRSPAEQWVRTKQGWENLRLWRVKLFENLNENIIARLMKLALTDWCVTHDAIHYSHQPHVPFTRGNPAERRIPMSLAEVFIRLDIAGAVRDMRRFNYVNSVMNILVGNKLAGLSGTAQKHVLNILEHMLDHCTKTNFNVAAVKRLIAAATSCVNDYHCAHVGSDKLWSSHKRYVAQLSDRLDNYAVTQREEDGGWMLLDLPEDCLYRILCEMSDHRDIAHTGMTSTFLYDLSEDPELWKSLSQFHFSQFQLMTFLPKETRDDNVNWKNLYRRCMRRYGEKNVYADMIVSCCRCDTLFWQSRGHPCLTHENSKHTVLTPEQFVEALTR